MEMGHSKIKQGIRLGIIRSGSHRGAFNNDNKLDLVVVNTQDNTASVLLGNGDGTFQNQTIYLTGQNPTAVITEDFNNDKKLDLAVANNDDNTVSILLGNGNGTFRKQATHDAGNYPTTLIADDFNNDRKIDLAVGNSGGRYYSCIVREWKWNILRFHTS